MSARLPPGSQTGQVNWVTCWFLTGVNVQVCVCVSCGRDWAAEAASMLRPGNKSAKTCQLVMIIALMTGLH